MSFKIIADYHTHTNLARGYIPLFNTLFGEHAKGSIECNARVGIEYKSQQILKSRDLLAFTHLLIVRSFSRAFTTLFYL